MEKENQNNQIHHYDESNASVVNLTINGNLKQLKVQPWVSLLDAIRDHSNLTGTKKDVIMGNVAPALFYVMVKEY